MAKDKVKSKFLQLLWLASNPSQPSAKTSRPKRRKRNRINAFYHAMGCFGGGCDPQFRRALILCKACNHWIFFGDFCRNAEWTGNGQIISLTCPKCKCVMERKKS